jgi:hypothetical protein
MKKMIFWVTGITASLGTLFVIGFEASKYSAEDVQKLAPIEFSRVLKILRENESDYLEPALFKRQSGGWEVIYKAKNSDEKIVLSFYEPMWNFVVISNADIGIASYKHISVPPFITRIR